MTVPARMTAIAIRAPGGPEMLVPEERPVVQRYGVTPGGGGSHREARRDRMRARSGAKVGRLASF